MKNKTKKIIGLLIAILLVVLIQAVGITYAKYVTSDSNTGVAEIAEWSFKMEKEGEETQTIQLINTYDTNSLIDGKIAPGTGGTFKIIIDGTGSEVGIDYDIKFSNEQNKPNNLYFKYAGKQYESLSDLIIEGSFPLDSENKRKTIVVDWGWDYEKGSTDEEIAANDALDTQDANAITQYTFDVTATGTQSK